MIPREQARIAEVQFQAIELELAAAVDDLERALEYGPVGGIPRHRARVKRLREMAQIQETIWHRSLAQAWRVRCGADKSKKPPVPGASNSLERAEMVLNLF